MSSWRRPLPILGLIAPMIFACGGDDVVVTPDERDELVLGTESADPCAPGDAYSSLSFIDAPLPFSGRAEHITSQCSCKYTTRDNGWSCSNVRHCQSEYNIGGDNPTECADVSRDVEEVVSVSATVDDESCTASARVENGNVEGTVHCHEPGRVAVTVSAQTRSGGIISASFRVRVITPDTMDCDVDSTPPARPSVP